MKKMFLVLLCVISLMVSACSRNSLSAPVSKESCIEGLNLTSDQQELINLVKNGRSVSFSSFSVADSIKSIEIILDVYQNGKLTDSVSGGAQNLTVPDGKIAVMPDADNNTQFYVSLENGSSTLSWTLASAQSLSDLNRSELCGVPKTSVPAGGGEYPLYARFFYKSNTWAGGYNMLNEPAQLKDFDDVYIIECKFSTQAASQTRS